MGEEGLFDFPCISIHSLHSQMQSSLDVSKACFLCGISANKATFQCWALKVPTVGYPGVVAWKHETRP